MLIDEKRRSLYGMNFYESPYLPTKTESYEEVVELSFKERWIEPLKNWNTQPFEPWVKTKVVIKYRQVPSNDVYILSDKFIASPEMIKQLKRDLEVYNGNCT